jgi:hypothetical protein
MKDTTPEDTSTENGRINWVCQALYGGSQTRMAADLRVSQPVLSRVIRGERAASPRLLAAVSALPRINTPWLYTGKGEPLLPAEQGAPIGGRTLPISTAILGGLPSDRPFDLSGLHLPVADFFFRPSRYWLEVPNDAPAALLSSRCLMPGDYLLMEADVRHWRDHPAILHGRLCGVRRERDGTRSYTLAAIARDPSTGDLTFDDFDPEGGGKAWSTPRWHPGPYGARGQPAPDASTAGPEVYYRRIRPPRQVDTGPAPGESVAGSGGPATPRTTSPKDEPKRTTSPKDEPKRLHVDDVVALQVLLLRR